jgi:hypothetical protein
MLNNKELGGWIKLPKDSVVDIEQHKKKLSFVSPFADDNGNRKTILSYKETDDFFYVPRRYMSYSECIDKTNSINIDTVFTKFPDPNHPRVKNPKAQKKFMDDMYEALITNREVLACAQTGSRKDNLRIVRYTKAKTKNYSISSYGST